MKATIHVKSSNRMSNRQYHRHGKPTWWVRLGQGDNAQFLPIPRVRGDEYLDVTVEVERHPTEKLTLYWGVGPRDGGVREQMHIRSAAEVVAAKAAKAASDNGKTELPS